MNHPEKLFSMVIKREGRIISKEFLGNKTKIEFECKEQHRWKTKPELILLGHWCPICNRSVPYTIEDMKRVALGRNGKCLSEVYINAHTKLLWECEKGHKWEAIPKSIYLNGTWCAICNKVAKLSIEDMKSIAKERNGLCLSTVYINNREKLLWRCEKGHEWQSSAANIKSGKWCPRCAKNRIPIIEDMRVLAKERGGECLSSAYKGKYVKLTWKCKDGHKWLTTPAIIKSGSWCPKCSKKSKLNILDLDLFTKLRGGKCLSIFYINSKTPLLFECKDRHQWSTTYGNLLGGSWCPECYQSRGEERTRYILEELLNHRFKKTRKVLDDGLELDGYNEELNIGFEFCGIQHYKFTPYFHRSKKRYNELLERNIKKKNQCKEKGISLLVVPYWVEEESEEALIHFIIEWLNSKNISFHKKKLSFASVQNRNSKIEEMKGISEKKEGKCLSTVYRISKYHYEFECKEGHKWRTSYDVIARGGWCPKCGGNAKHTIEEMKEFAGAKGGSCLSTEYINNNTHLVWKCEHSHEWKATPSNILRGKWCPICNKHPKLNIALFDEIAKKKGGKCLSIMYSNQKTKMFFECKRSHKWYALSGNIQKGKWCPTCSGNRKKTIEEMKELAQQKEGKCLSKVYINSKTKLIWKCKNNHRWLACYSDIKNGSWCQICIKKK